MWTSFRRKRRKEGEEEEEKELGDRGARLADKTQMVFKMFCELTKRFSTSISMGKKVGKKAASWDEIELRRSNI